MSGPTDVLFIPHVDGCVTFLGMRHDLTRHQSAIVTLLYENRGRVVTREMVGERLWGAPENWPDTWSKQIDVYMTKARAVLPKNFIVTEYDRMCWRDGWRHLGTSLCRIRGKFKGWKLVGEVKTELFVRESRKRCRPKS